MKANKLSLEDFSSFKLKKNELAIVGGFDFTVIVNTNIYLYTVLIPPPRPTGDIFPPHPGLK
jgi:hypothetical protein